MNGLKPPKEIPLGSTVNAIVGDGKEIDGVAVDSDQQWVRVQTATGQKFWALKEATVVIKAATPATTPPPSSPAVSAVEDDDDWFT